MKETGIGDLLVRSGVVDAAGLARARRAQEKSGLPLTTTLATLGLADEQGVITAIATSMRLEALGPELPDVEAEVAALLPADFCRSERLRLCDSKGRSSGWRLLTPWTIRRSRMRNFAAANGCLPSLPAI